MCAMHQVFTPLVVDELKVSARTTKTTGRGRLSRRSPLSMRMTESDTREKQIRETIARLHVKHEFISTGASQRVGAGNQRTIIGDAGTRQAGAKESNPWTRLEVSTAK